MMNADLWQPLALAVGLTTLGMLGTWCWARRLRNFGIVDAVWSLLFAPVCWVYCWLGNGWTTRRLILAGMVTLWSFRLGAHLAVRIRSQHPQEDSRYAELRAEWGDAVDCRMLGFYALQGGLIVILSLPFLWPVGNGAPALAALEWWGLAGFLIGTAGETLADAQLAKAKRAGDRVCRRGLWNFSRHPNYFFEWLVWVGFALFGSASDWGWLGWLSPVLMLHFLLNVTGIPMTEALAVRRKGDAYRKYQRTTNAFFPWFRKKL